MASEILCIKIHQKSLTYFSAKKDRRTYDYFPFDRIYLIPPSLVRRIPELFRVSLDMELTSIMLHSLNQINYSALKHSTLARNYDSPAKVDTLEKLINTPQGWRMVVPSYLHNYGGANISEHTASDIAYLLSSAVGVEHNKGVSLPPITLHTPMRTYPLLCLGCERMAEQMAGDCAPGEAKCRNNRHFKLPVDPLAVARPPLKGWRGKKGKRHP